MTPATPSVPSFQRLREITQELFGKRACYWQLKSGIANYTGKDVVVCSRTGSGKTLGFYIPQLIAREQGHHDKISFVVSPLTQLGKQAVAELEKAKLSAIAVNRESISNEVMKDIEKGKYNVVVISPELLMGDERFTNLWNKRAFTSRLLNFVFDEAHCISKWGKFRNEYLKVGSLRHLIPERIPFYVTSATLPAAVLQDVVSLLQLRRNETEYIMRSNERPDIALMVNHLEHSVGSFQDLAFLVSDWANRGDDDPPPKKFVVFFDNIKDTEKAAEFLKQQLPDELKGKIRYFHATMTQKYRQDTLEALRKGEIWGICATDAFGLGMDLPDIEIVVQWRSTCDMCTLWQRFGRAVRGIERIGIAIFLVDKKEFEQERQARAERAEKRKKKRQEKRGMKRKGDQAESPSKRLAITPRNPIINRTNPLGEPGSSNTQPVPVLEVTESDRHSDNDDNVSDFDFSNEEEVGLHVASSMERVYARIDREAAARSKTRGVAVEVGGAIDHLINPGNGGYGNCRRHCPREYFGVKRAQASDHLLCDPTSPSGCSYCRPRPITICCDLCHPSFFAPYRVPPVKNTRGPNKTRAAEYEMSPRDIAFRNALVDWRKEAALAELGPFLLRDYGVKFILPDDTLDHIVNCFHRGTITGQEQLSRETDGLADEYSAAILSLIHKHSPPPPPLVEPAAAGVDGKGKKARKSKGQGKENAQGPTRAPQTCGRCHTVGHNRSNRSCPMYPKASFERPDPTAPISGPSPAPQRSSEPVPSSSSISPLNPQAIIPHDAAQLPSTDAPAQASTSSRNLTPSAKLPSCYDYVLSSAFMKLHR